MLPTAPAPQSLVAKPPTTAGHRLAQGIVCGQWALAFSFDWARQIEDHFELSAIPKAPNWLSGAANIAGSIVPVIDLARYFGHGIADTAHPSRQRLLVGGLAGADAEEAIAFAFTGLPTQLKYLPEKLSYPGALPLKLREVCDGVARDAGGRDFLEINIARLKATLADELSLL